MKEKSWLLAILLIVLPVNTLAINPEERVQYYIDKYGIADEKNELVQRVYQVFERVKLVADKRAHLLPELKIIKKKGKKNEPLAIALPDGNIILSQRAVKFIYDNVSRKQGDTRIAFVLGHELTHLANNDFRHFFNVSAADKNTKAASCQETKSCFQPEELQKLQKNNEINADKQGFIYAAMAGYPVNKLLTEKTQATQENFFSYWEEQAFRKKSGIHPSSEVRERLLRQSLQDLLAILPYFQFGVRLAHFDHCDDAIYFFKEFLTVFPSREVFNNLGVCELQRAQKELGDAAYSYWLPSVLEVASQLEDFELPSIPKGEELSTLARRFLNRAKRYFQLALDSDPSYLSTRLNLMTTTLYLGEIYEARAEIEKARQLAPNDPEIQGWRAVILYEEGRQSSVDMWPDVIELLEKLQQPHLPPSALYNKARLLEQRGRTGADKIWQQLAQVTDLPIPIRDIVCGKTTCPTLRRNQAPQAHWNLPVEVGMRTKRNKTLDQWKQSKSVRLHDIDEKIYQHPNEGAEVLGLRNRVEMVVLKKLGQITVKDLPAYCRQPLRERRVVNGTLLSCEYWAARVVNNQIKEVWIIKK